MKQCLFIAFFHPGDSLLNPYLTPTYPLCKPYHGRGLPVTEILAEIMKNILSHFTKIPRYIRFYRALRRSNYGRDYGWFIELDGERVGELVDVKWEDQFWFSYRVVPANAACEEILLQKDLWDRDRFRFTNKYLPGRPRYAFSSSAPGKGERVSIRGLHM
jgi:hypothetical protein